MILYIHFGIYKAGSSYLQYILANSKEFLLQKGVYFPGSKEDGKMLDGNISAGNADGLQEALKTADEKKCTDILQKWWDKGKKGNCDKILISAEALVHQFAKPKTIKILERSAKKAGFSEIHAMGFFRDLADHALSTYKHRGKSGTISDFDNWLSHTYETPALLSDLYKIRSSSEYGIHWTFRKFKKDSFFMEQAFFEWLKVPIPSFQGKQQVNESVTLSEVCVMNELAKVFPQVTDYFVEGFKSLPSNQKVKDTTLQNHFHNIAVHNLNQYQNVLDSINNFLPEGEKLIVGNAIDLEKKTEKVISLSPNQLRVLFEGIQHFQKLGGKRLLLQRKIKTFLPKVLVDFVVKAKSNRSSGKP